MSSGFGDLTQQANQLVAAGNLAGAQELLGDALSNADPSPANASPDLAEAAGLQARVLVALGEPHSARGWAAFAYSATSRLHGPADARTVAAAATLAAVLHRVGSHSRSALLYRDVIIELTATDGPESLRVLAAHADLATVEYARGECEVARTRLQEAWELHREVYGDGHLSGIKMLARLGAMQRDCGHFTEGHEKLALARELCREYLPPDHPLASQVAALARAAANPDHVCAPQVPPEASGPAAAAIPPQRTGQDPVDQHAPAPYGPAPTRHEATYAPPTRHEATYHPPTVRHDTGHHQPTVRHEATDRSSGRVADPDFAPEDDPDPTGGYQTTSIRFPPEAHAGYSPPHPEPPLPPAVPAMAASGRASRQLPAAPSDVGDGSDGAHRDRHLPARRHAALPVRIHHPPKVGRRTAPIVFAGLVVVLLGAGAVVAGFALVDGQEQRSPAPTGAPSGSADASAAPTGPAVATPGTPPTEVRLRDGRDRVSLAWTYPAGAEGPVVVSGGRSGQEPRAFQELPAGATSFVVYGLNQNTDYCFSIAVVYSVDLVGRADPICTDRISASPER